MTSRYGEPHQDWGREPCGGLGPSTSSCVDSGEEPRERGRRTRCGAGAASMGSTAAVHPSEHCGVALMRLQRSETHVELEREEVSSAASPPQTSSALAGLRTDLHRSVCDLPHLAGDNVRLGSYSVPLGSGLTMSTGAKLDLWVRGVAHAPFRHAGRGSSRATMGAFGTDEGRASSDPIRAAAS